MSNIMDRFVVVKEEEITETPKFSKPAEVLATESNDLQVKWAEAMAKGDRKAANEFYAQKTQCEIEARKSGVLDEFYAASYGQTQNKNEEKEVNKTMKKIMVKAWEIARAGAVKFGGKVKEYFAEALKMAWAETKTVTPEQAMDAFVVKFNRTIGAESDVKAAKWQKGDKLRVYFNFADFRNAKVFVDFDRKCNNITTAETRASKYNSITQAINAFVNEMNSKFYTGNCGWV